MSKLKLTENKIRVRISEADRQSLFQKTVLSDKGKEIFIITDVQAQDDQDRFYSQTVNMGIVIDVADDVTSIKKDDILWFDNLVDSGEGIIIEVNKDYKDVVIIAEHTYHKNDYLIPPHKNQIRPQWVWRKGDMDQMSRIVGIVRDGVIMAPKGYVIAEYHDDNRDIKKIPGLEYDIKTSIAVPRKIMVPHQDSGYIPGMYVMVDRTKVMTYDFGRYNCDIFFEEDILMSFEV